MTHDRHVVSQAFTSLIQSLNDPDSKPQLILSQCGLAVRQMAILFSVNPSVGCDVDSLGQGLIDCGKRIDCPEAGALLAEERALWGEF